MAIWPPYLSCPFCPSQSYLVQDVEYFISGEGEAVLYICHARHEFYIEQQIVLSQEPKEADDNCVL